MRISTSAFACRRSRRIDTYRSCSSRWVRSMLATIVATPVTGSLKKKGGTVPTVVKRGLTALALIAGVALASVGSGTAEAAVQRGLPNTLQNVILVMQNQHTDLAIAKGHSSPRVDANHKDQSGLIAKARSKGASNLRGFDTVNAVAATVTPDQAAQLAADPTVAAVFPDLPVRKGPQMEKAIVAASARPDTVPSSGVCPSDPS